MGKECKITFIGDIMCEPMLLKAARLKNGTFNFDCVFEHVKDLFSDADYVIGNLESPVAGREAGYVQECFSMNSPDEFIDALMKAGVSCVSTANNHCLDRGYEGLVRTIQTLDSKGLSHHGTFLDEGNRKEAVYCNINGITVAVICYTYATNYQDNKCSLTEEQEKNINLLHHYQEKIYLKTGKKASFPQRCLGRILRPFKQETRASIKKALGLPYNSARADDYLDAERAEPYFKRLEDDIKTAKEKADLVVFYPHVGGQFNIEPGAFSKYTVDRAISCEVDAVIASHAHIVQKAEYKNDIPCFYSIGNFSMSPNSSYLLHEYLPEYGLAVHLYLNDSRIQKTAFSILKIVETKKQPLTVYPVDRYIASISDRALIEKTESEILQIYRIVTGRSVEAVEVKREYLF